MKVLLIGYGSIGKKHYSILSDMSQVGYIDVVSRQSLNLPGNVYADLKSVSDLKAYDYFVVASETYKHYEQLRYLCENLNNKKVLVEKPLFHELCEQFAINGNEVYVAYNLRYHPVLQKVKALVKNKKINTVHIYCGQYLPTWRPQTDYRASYSASKKQGGGVLRDLSHELDYMQWLFGDLQSYASINDKVSNLEIETDDVYQLLGKTKEGAIINLSVDYLSKKPARKIMVHLEDKSIYADLIEQTIEVVDHNGVTELMTFPKEADISYKKMHADLLADKLDACTLEEGLAILPYFGKVNKNWIE